MGVLDDAIREHLELKRQHGVAEEEVLRQEEEALGPARRDVAPAESAEDDVTAAEAEAEAEAEEVEEEAVAPDAVEHPALEAVEPRALDTVEPRAPDTVESEPVEAPPEAPGAAFDGDAFDEPIGTTPAGGFERLDEEDHDADVLEEADEESGPEDEHRAEDPEDVLEDTPDFLQETPEHDRLWFEQKPPRDFDFD